MSNAEGAQAEVTLTVAEVEALGRIQEDAIRLLWPVVEGGAFCQYTPQAIGVTIYQPDSTGMRYVVVAYNPDHCPIPMTFPLIHKSLAYVLSAKGQLFGPRVHGR
ncbi:hypothetical protein ACN469_04660 [Corallococcus terminator]